MRGTSMLAIRPAVTGLLILSTFAVGIGLAAVPSARAQGGPTLAVDADATGNSATALGQRDVCIQVHSGDTFQVDVTTENVQELAAWDGYLKLDVNTVHIIDRSADLLLASVPESDPFDVSESVPEGDADDGRYHMGAAIISDPPLSVTGSGVLTRLTLEAVRSGVTTLSVQPIQTNAGTIGTVLTDVNANHIGDEDGDSFFDGPTLDAKVAVDEDCPADGDGPIAVITGGGGEGMPAWLIAAAAVGLVAAAGFGGAALFRLRRAGSRGAP